MEFGVTSDGWRTVTPSFVAWRAAAFEALRRHFGGQHAFACWANFQFVGTDGTLGDVDLLAVTRRNVYLVAIDPRPLDPCPSSAQASAVQVSAVQASERVPREQLVEGAAREAESSSSGELLSRTSTLARQLRRRIDAWVESRGSRRRCPPIRGVVFHAAAESHMPVESSRKSSRKSFAEGLDGRFTMAPLEPAEAIWEDVPSSDLLSTELQDVHSEYAWVADELAWQSVVVPLFDVFFAEADVRMRPEDVSYQQLLQAMALACQTRSPEQVVAEWTSVAVDLHEKQLPFAFLNDVDDDPESCLVERLKLARHVWTECRGRMRAIQEELDWREYSRAGLIEEDLSVLGMSFEQLPRDANELLTLAPAVVFDGQLALDYARSAFGSVAEGARSSTRPGIGGTAVLEAASRVRNRVELPAHWSTEYRELVERRIAAISQSPTLARAEQRRFKQSWELPSWQSQQDKALREWLLDRLASHLAIDHPTRDFSGPRLEAADRPLTPRSFARLLDAVANDRLFADAAYCLRNPGGNCFGGDPPPNLTGLLGELLG